MEYRRAVKEDITALTDMRIEFLGEHNGNNEKAQTLRAQLEDYLKRHLGWELLAYVAEEDGEAVSSAFLLIEEKPANFSFPTGKTGTILNVYTRPEYRRCGAAKELMKMAMADGIARELSYIDLKATEQGLPLYKSLGFAPEASGDVSMKYDLLSFRIEPVDTDRKRYIDMLLDADEQEDMIDRYIDRGDMYALLDDGEARCVCVVTDEGEGVLEIKNISTAPAHRCRGYARAMIEYLFERYRGRFTTMHVGTGDSPAILPFYEKCGFKRAYVVKDFFTDNYDHPIYDGGVRLSDMVYLVRGFPPSQRR